MSYSRLITLLIMFAIIGVVGIWMRLNEWYFGPLVFLLGCGGAVILAAALVQKVRRKTKEKQG